ncbi:hypothetical protein EWM64_g4818 [Hericium alpestre]|uniref:F-box domain-containing protein n=1 Tax=Hericium alpestre TaxID=135208 RepID=A0A4Y9ZZ10_9AGAM|nr:hypothetical protein EWM64_g4818 [Hericium alpestre]
MSSPVDDTRYAHTTTPLDIWIEIFDIATYVPGVLDTEPGDSFSSPETWLANEQTWRDAYLSLRAVNRTALSLSLVCKDFASLVLPLLYRYVAIDSRRDWESFSRTLETTAMREPSSDGHPGGLGRYVRHVQLRTRTFSFLSRDPFPASYTLAFNYLPGLQSLSIDRGHWTNEVEAQFVKAVLSSCSATLRKLCIDPRPYERIDIFPPSFPNLQVLLNRNGCPLHLPSAPQLSHLTLCSSDCVSKHTHDKPLPNVRRVCVQVPCFPFIEHWRRFLTVQGRLLTTVYIHCAPDGGENDGMFQAVKDYCPNLESLIVRIDRSYKYEALVLPVVGRLGVSLSDWPPRCRTNALEEFQEWFEVFARRVGASAKVVRLLDATLSQDVQDWITDGVDLGPVDWSFKVEDCFGREIQAMSCQVDA